MKLTSFKNDFSRNLSNIPGWRTDRKIVVIESDDWGSLRMPSLAAFEKLEKQGLDLRSQDAERYNMNDTLATVADLEGLFEILSSCKDILGNHAVFTPISIVTNPDFQKIQHSEFKEYHSEPFTETLKRFPGCENSYNLWLQGIRNKIFIPQMHGREHLNVSAWMKELQANDRDTQLAFNECVTGFVPRQYPAVDYQAAFLVDNAKEIEDHKTIIKEGLDIFEKLFGYRATYFVPPNGPFNNNLNQTLYKNGVRLRSVSKIQREPVGQGKYKRSIHWLGQKEKNGIRYITRNCFFEPSQPGKDWINSCLFDIETAFRWHKPAIISTHRVNYIGALNPANRDNGLRQLKELLQTILRKWPDAEFMTTAQLGQLIERS